MECYDVTIRLRMVQTAPLRPQGGKYANGDAPDMQQVAETAATQVLIAMAGGTHCLAGRVQFVQTVLVAREDDPSTYRPLG